MMATLSTACAGFDGPTWVELVRGDQIKRFAGLMADLRLKFAPCGDGKRITCSYAYMGLEPALAWADACRDRLYPVMRQIIKSFDQWWPSIRTSLDAPAYHYVSLDPGDGKKDGIMSNLRHDHRELGYLPADASTEMLRLAVRDLIVRLNLPSSNIVALPWDFSTRHNVTALRYLLDGAFGDAPVLFSLMGNTLANFDDAAGLLTQLTTELLRPQDRLLLEVETTPHLSDKLANQAAE
jgi:L-histidine Nalpha-methyltransferase